MVSPRPTSTTWPARSPQTSAQRLESLLRDLGPQLRLGAPPGESEERCATGLPELDRLLGGGFRRGRLGEISGSASSGRTSLALTLLARATAAGEFTAVVDAADALDPTSAAAAGVALDRVLWVRAPGLAEALRSSERLLEARGFALVLLDLVRPGIGDGARATWPRLARAAASTGSALVVLSGRRRLGSFADLAVEMRPARARFQGRPALLEGLDVEAVLVRSRAGPLEDVAALRLRSPSAA